MLEKNWRIIIFLECYVYFKKKELKKKLYYWSIFIINLMIIWCFFIDFKNKLLRCELKIGGVRNFLNVMRVNMELLVEIVNYIIIIDW